MSAKSRARISVRLDQETQQRLTDEVRATGKNESDVVREALRAYFRKRPRAESCLELARRNRLIGCAKQFLPDLSTNRRHFEGFGR
jgi:Arc/MetJ-type ribon-helix-helix transcriptional regulator